MKLFQTNSMYIIKSCQSYFSFQLPSAVLSKRVAKFNMKFKNHQNQLCRIINSICNDIMMCKYFRKSCRNCVTLIHCLVKFIVWYVFLSFLYFLPVVVNKDGYKTKICSVERRYLSYYRNSVKNCFLSHKISLKSAAELWPKQFLEKYNGKNKRRCKKNRE